MASEGTAYANAYFVKNWYAIPNLPIYNEDGSFYEGFPLDQLNVPNPLRDQGLDKNTPKCLEVPTPYGLLINNRRADNQGNNKL